MNGHISTPAFIINHFAHELNIIIPGQRRAVLDISRHWWYGSLYRAQFKRQLRAIDEREKFLKAIIRELSNFNDH